MKGSKQIIFRYSITAAFAAVVTLLMLYLQGFWGAFDLAQKYKILADAFTIPGMFLMMAAALIWISSQGIFDGITYAIRQFSGIFIPEIDKKYKHLKYYDYITQRQGKRPRGHRFLFVVGLVFTVIAVVFVMLFNSAYLPKV